MLTRRNGGGGGDRQRMLMRRNGGGGGGVASRGSPTWSKSNIYNIPGLCCRVYLSGQ